MIDRKDIYPGLRIMGYSRDINPQDAITGTVMRVIFSGEGTTNYNTYLVYILPDIQSAPGLTSKNSTYGLINIAPDQLHPLTEGNKPAQDKNRLFRPFSCEIDIIQYKGEKTQEKINNYFQDIASMLYLYGYDVSIIKKMKDIFLILYKSKM